MAIGYASWGVGSNVVTTWRGGASRVGGESLERGEKV